MKTKQWICGLSLALLAASTQVACQSKTEQKADKVGDEYKDVIEAQKEGDSSDVQEEQTELDSARQDYRELKQDSTKK
ncbi:hypothetical protein GCM10028803_41830 [Larkinella knui]|uniref:YtxH domain-containing protein n=1 Tax=Larkinella knui TaxID=2025310 RepID=A0A3P1CNA4_9BACT|nr:hypothetical protein [Larkinella knui]RRB14813.1 hypothetical protein EHT87_09600 [Larkinella knui]